MNNPFAFGDPVQREAFINRHREIRRLVSRILKGQSALISSEPRLGKTSLLLRIQEPALYGDEIRHLHFCFLDAQILAKCDVAHFWMRALQPVQRLSPSIEEAYTDAAREHFGTFSLERILKRLEDSGERLVLLLDEFDAILDISTLHTVEFYGGLRSLASRFASLSLIIAARRSVEDLNRCTQDFNRTGSPYFNFVEEITLGSLSGKSIGELLGRAGNRFSREDRLFLARLSGGHPYFLQMAASYLWDAYDEGQPDPDARRRWAGEQCLRQARQVLEDTWRLWTPYQRMAFALAALNAMPYLVPGRKFDIHQLLKIGPDLKPEQQLLCRRGFLDPAPELAGGYAPRAEIFLWFLSEELTRMLRLQDPDWLAWLRQQEWDNLLRRGDRENLINAIKTLGPILSSGAGAFIRSAAEGFYRGLLGLT